MRRLRNQQGTVAVVLSIVICFVLIPMSALAVDVGMQRVARRDMQSLADVVALDLVRQLNGGTLQTYHLDVLQAVADASRDRNSGSLGSGDNGKSADITFKLGTVNSANYGQSSYFTQTTDPTGIPTAVQVSAHTKVGFGLARALPGGGVGNGAATRTAIAVSQSSACFDLGSYAAAIDTSGSTLLGPLNGLLGLNLGLVSYQGLAAANLNLADIAADANIGSVDALFGSNVTIGSFTAAAISVLSNQNSPSNAAAITALQAIRASGIDLSKKVNVANVANVQKTDAAGLVSNIDALDLIAGAIQVANGSHAVDISSLNIAGITGGVTVTQGIQRACGTPGAVANASQISANLNIPLTFPTGSSVLGLTVTGNATVTGGVGNATGKLVSPITCGANTAASPSTYGVDVNGGLLGLGVQANLNINGTVSTGLLGGLLDLLLGVLVKVQFNNVSITLGTAAPGTSGSTVRANLKVPQNAINTSPRGTPVKTGSAYGGLGTVPSLTTTTVVGGTIQITTTGLLGLGPPTVTTINLNRGGSVGTLISTLLGTVNSTLSTVVNGAVVPTLNNLLTPLATLLGVNAGGSDVYSEMKPSCNGAKLAG
ncbi:MAG: pilus assembly protein TadG-related protein [Marmoricola sp.]